MAFFNELRQVVDTLEAALGDDSAAVDLPRICAVLSDDTITQLLGQVTTLTQRVDCLRATLAGVVATRSVRDYGHEGMAQTRGHRDAASLIQDLTGTSRGDAVKQVKLGEALLEAGLPEVPAPEGVRPESQDSTPAREAPDAPVERPWHAALSDAVLNGVVSSAVHGAIRRGLAEPPVILLPSGSADEAATAAARAAWRDAAARLIAESSQRTIEELERAARTIRDLLDPAGAEERYAARFAKRSFRRYTDGDGQQRATIVFDDASAVLLDSIFDAALRPRRGGPRFVDDAESARAAQLTSDPRTNEQLAFDLLIDLIHAGALAQAEAVFGTRQAGVRLVASAAALTDAEAGAPAVAVTEDDGVALPAWLAGQQVCGSGTVACTLDSGGNPLDLGREERLFSSKQKLTLAIRDGGCRWPDCDRPASYTEAHHIDPWSAGGHTNVDRGILLCRFHHGELHHHRWRITRRGSGEFVLHPPPGDSNGSGPIVLTVRLARQYLFDHLNHPEPRFRPPPQVTVAA